MGSPTQLDPITREIDAKGHRYTLRAAPDTSGGWLAGIVSYTLTGGAQMPQSEIPGLGSANPAGILTAGWTAKGADGEAAISALAERIRGAIDAALREDLAEANRRRRG